MEAAIYLENVTKKYSKFTLDHVTMEIPRGCIVGLVGENGAGKTTLIKAILQMTSIQEGKILLDGQPMKAAMPQWKDQAGVILAGVEFASRMNACEMGNCMQHVYKNWQGDVFEKYLTDFQIDKKEIIKNYSKGMKMKLDLAIALSHQAKILILDEATSGLDPVVRDDILDILLDFIQKEDHTVLISSHIITDLEKIADYIAFLHEGKLQFYMNKDELLSELAVVRCTQEECEKIPGIYVQGIRRNQFGCEVLIRNRTDFQKQFSSYQVDCTTIEEIILFHVKGEKR